MIYSQFRNKYLLLEVQGKYHDYNMLMIISIITGAIVVFSNFIVKIINSKIDPRVEENGGNSFEFPK